MKRTKRHSSDLRIFLSHNAGTDQELIRHLRKALAAHFQSVFTTEEITVADDWLEKLRSELADSDLVIVLLTPAAFRSSWILYEVGAAWALEKPIIPVLTPRASLNWLPISLDPNQTLELKQGQLDTPQGREQFNDELERTLANLHIHA
jgi:nucleoside 2-deoxyribosyltransferase